MVSLRRHFVPNPVPSSGTQFSLRSKSPLFLHTRYDVALIFSQDQDLSEVADEVRSISAAQDRWIKLACAFPVSPTYDNTRGINKTDWIEIDRAVYDACLDPTDYRAKGAP